ncbi:endonuclease domain-containing protein [Shewanella marina]|uniref:endonuclease domain-containing protein n=1 Tax=Shewanella marina TaxID=487319 RepID=UPI0004719D8F|nr:hypothetical protein [Shewanella marina]
MGYPAYHYENIRDNRVSDLEALFTQQLKALKLPVAEREFRFHPRRRWRFDFAWPELKLAVEVEGGIESHGKPRTINGKQVQLKSRHLTAKGFQEDCVKYNAAAVMGWKVLRFSGAMVRRGEAIEQIESALRALG